MGHKGSWSRVSDYKKFTEQKESIFGYDCGRCRNRGHVEDDAGLTVVCDCVSDPNSKFCKRRSRGEH